MSQQKVKASWALATLVDALAIPTEVAARMKDLRAPVPGRWQVYGDILFEPIQALIELEENASWVRSFDGPVIPGLLQTRDYAERIITAGSMHLRVGDINRSAAPDLRLGVSSCEVDRLLASAAAEYVASFLLVLGRPRALCLLHTPSALHGSDR